ncbi:hydrolase [Devosia sp. SL43]|uniref:hydrolase n=1 Tax=Devosia sp. SL43 TaxID=2806348 RepID=UPI001F2BF1C7|nr:hydrolase [Devosia sp. SL43]UJW85049.1 hydrolase [Devosia sp. SL43]UJW86529.1 hydrolase [Devosia sp. SL43]
MNISNIFKALTLVLPLGLVGANAEAAPAASSLLTPDNHVLLLIDHQPQMAFATRSIDIAELRNNVTGLAKSAQVFDVPTILTTVAADSFSGKIFPEIQAVFPDQVPIDRSTMNTWEDQRVSDAVAETGRKKIVVSALWTEVCGVMPVLSALEQGYEVYFVTDASGGISDEANDRAIERMVQAGARPITWVQYLLELQRDWARGETYAAVMDIAKEHAGGYGLGIFYAETMFHAQEGQ